MAGVSSYILAEAAEADVSDIFDYTLGAHGSKQAADYLSGLEEALAALVQQPGLGRARPEIREGLHSIPYQHHVIFYRIMTDHLRIVRILHARRDLPAHLMDA